MTNKVISSLLASAALIFTACNDDSTTYEQVLINNTDQVLTVDEGSESCGTHTYILQPGDEQVIHSNHVKYPPSDCSDHHYHLVSEIANIKDIHEAENWSRTVEDGVTKCEFVFEYIDTTHTKDCNNH